jgi:hypothetical protein
VAALRWLTEGYGYEITSRDVVDAYAYTMEAADRAGLGDQTRGRIRDLMAKEGVGGRFVKEILSRRLGLP